MRGALGEHLWLVAEDRPDDFLLLQRACSRLQPRPKLQWMKDGIEARAYLAGLGRFANRTAFPMPSLVLSDLKMPGIDGLELLAWFRTQTQLRAIPFVLLTCSMIASDRQRAIDLHVDEYLVKPTESAVFLEVLQGLMDRFGGSAGRRSGQQQARMGTGRHGH